MKTEIICAGHGFKVDLEDELFLDGPILYPCPICKTRYLIYPDGTYKKSNGSALKLKPFLY